MLILSPFICLQTSPLPVIDFKRNWELNLNQYICLVKHCSSDYLSNMKSGWKKGILTNDLQKLGGKKLGKISNTAQVKWRLIWTWLLRLQNQRLMLLSTKSLIFYLYWNLYMKHYIRYCFAKNRIRRFSNLIKMILILHRGGRGCSVK